MKIVIIANNSNGLYLFRRQLISALIEQGHKVTALTPFDTDVDNLKKLGVTLVEISIDRRGTNPIRDYSLLKHYKIELSRIKPNLVITYTIKPNVYGGMACRALKIPYVANITGLGTAFEESGILRNVATILNKMALKNAKIVFFENTVNRDVFVNLGIVKKNRTHVLAGAGVDTEYFTYRPYPKNEIFGFLFIGRVMKEKGINELLDAMDLLIKEGLDCTLDILGSCEEDYNEQFNKLIDEGWLKYHGEQSDVRPFIEMCDCFVLPSYHEGMANTNLECASTGRPIITSDIPGCREAVIDGVSGILCEPKNKESLYCAMRRMLEKRLEEREKMGLAGREHIEKVFDKRKVVEETMRRLL